MNSKSFSLSRRHLLKGIGATVALPWLEAMGPLTRAATAQMGRGPVRFAALFVPNGVNYRDWVPETTGSRYQLSPILEPLKDVQDYVSVITGLYNESRGHAAGTGAWLTGMKVKETADASEVSVGCPSVDQVIAQSIGNQTKLPSLELGLHKPGRGITMQGLSQLYSSHISWKTDNIPVQFELSPRRTFDRLFRTINTGNNSNIKFKSKPLAESVNKSILDLVNQDAKALSRRLGIEDQQKLEEYLESVRDIERRLDSESGTRENDVPQRVNPQILSSIEATGKRLDKFDQGGADDDEFGESYRDNYTELCHLMLDMIALAFWTDSTRVSTLMFGGGVSGVNLSFLEGVDGSHHGLSHHREDPIAMKQYTRASAYYVEHYTYLLNKLRSFPEEGGNVLDNSVILLGSGLSDGNRHNSNDLPILLAGKGGGSLDPGRHIKKQDQPIGDLHRALLKATGVSAEFGDSRNAMGGI